MKKNYSFVGLVQAFIIIASALFFPVTAHSQDITEAERQERCQNNKNRIVELETQLRVINTDLSASMEEKEIEDARTQMVYVRSWKAPRKDFYRHFNEEWTKFSLIQAQHHFDYYKCLYNLTPNPDRDIEERARLKCLTELENIIGKKIDKALSLDRLALQAKKNETEKQLASHRNNLISLGCDAPKKDDGSFESKLSGYWELELGSPYGGTTQITVANGGVSGSSQRSANAVIKITGGSYDAATKKLSITYIQEWSKKTGKANFDFRESSSNYILTGIWRDDVSGSGNWVMTKKKQ